MEAAGASASERFWNEHNFVFRRGDIYLRGKVDASELPSSYKPAAAVAAQFESFGMAQIVDWIDPYGCIMAGDMLRFIRRPKGRR